MIKPEVNDWIEVSLGISPGKVLRVRENNCTVRFPVDDNPDGSPCFSEEDVSFDEITEIITDPAMIAFHEVFYEKEKRIQDLWPEWRTEERDEIAEMRCQTFMKDANDDMLAGLDKVIELLSSIK